MLLSHTTIVKNEAERIPAFLKCFEGLFDEFVMIDTGSTDGTLEIRHPKLRLMQSKRFTRATPRREFDFAAARNEGLDLVQGDWVGVLDPDDRATPEQIYLVRRFLLSDRAVPFELVFAQLRSGQETVPKPYFWRTKLGLRYENGVDEHINPAPGTRCMRLTNITFEHTRGPETVTPEAARAKGEFYVEILERELEEHPGDISLTSKLARRLLNIGRVDDAIALLTNVLKASADESFADPALAWVMVWLGQCYVRKGWNDAAIAQLYCAHDLCPNLAYAAYLIGFIYEGCGQPGEAEEWYRKALESPAPKGLFWMDTPEYRERMPREGLERIATGRREKGIAELNPFSATPAAAEMSVGPSIPEIALANVAAKL